MIKKEIIVENDKKLVNFLQDYGFSFAEVNKMLRNKDVKVNQKAEKENILLKIGDVVTFFFSEGAILKRVEPLFEDENVYIVYKPAGVEAAGEKGLESLLKGAIAVHRLDRNTEGLMIFAKNEDTKEKLEKAFKKNAVHKFYLAEVVGKFQTEEKVFKAYLSKDSENAIVKIYPNLVKGSQEIRTKFKTLRAGAESSLVEIELLTGKTHQIRAHLAFLKHPIIGDGKYGKNEINKKFHQNRQKLACFKLKFDYIDIEALNFKTFEKFPKWYNF